MPIPKLEDRALAVNPNWPPDLFDVVIISLTRGKFTCIDAADFPAVGRRKWFARRGNSGVWYATTNEPWHRGETRHAVSMHQLIAGAKPGETIDHRDRNGLNNRRRNLRRANASQSSANTLKKISPHTGLRGVWLKNGRFISAIRISRRRIHLGRFDSAADAARAYDAAARLYHGEFAITNEGLGLLAAAAKVKEVAG